MINNRYRILNKLGEGGTGEVYLASDEQSGAPVAVKFLNPDRLLDPESVKHEFDLLREFTHPHVIRVFEFGRVRSAPAHPALLNRYYTTMEYIDGSDALNHFEQMRDGPGKAFLLEEMVIQLLLALESIHRNRIIHYDIKPQNIFVVRDATGGTFELKAKLADFGLSTNDSTDSPGAPPPVRGTIGYIAPELLEGRPADGRIDLFSLGATIHHLWNGQSLIRGSTVLESLRSVLEATPPPLTKWKGASLRLQKVVSRLLQVNPDERYATAWDALSEFAGTEHEEKIKQSLIAISAATRVGRHTELARLKGEIDAHRRATSPHRKAIVIEGPPGCGKTTLLEWVARTLDPDCCTIVRLPAEEAGLAGESAQCAPRSAPNASPHPVVALIDDMDTRHEGHRSASMKWLDELGNDRNLLLIGTTGEEDYVKREPAMAGVSADRLLLTEFTAEETQQLFDVTFGDGVVPRMFIDLFHSFYGGRPRLVQKAIHMLANAIPLRLLRDGGSFIALQPGLEDLLAIDFATALVQECLRMPGEKQIVLRILSCFRSPVPIELLRIVAPFGPSRLMDLMRSLERSGHVSGPNSGEGYALRHKSLQQRLYDLLGSEERVRFHEFAARFWESMDGTGKWEVEEELGRQLELGGNRARARAHYELSGDLASERGRHTEAAALYVRASELSLNGMVMPLRMKLARAYVLAGADAECVEIWKSLLEEPALAQEEKTESAKELGKALARLGEHAQAGAIFQNLLADRSGTIDLFDVKEEIVSLKIAAGHFDEALALGSSQRALAESCGDRERLALVETDIGIAHFYKGELKEALESFARSRRIYQDAGIAEKVVTSLNNIGNVLSAMGEIRRAMESWNQALAAAQDPSMQRQRGLLLNNVGIAHFKLGEFSEARVKYRQAHQLFIELQQKSETAYVLTNLGEVELAEGNYEQAIQSSQDALRLYREIRSPLGLGQSLLALAAAYLTVGDTDRSRMFLNEAAVVAKDLSIGSIGPQLRYLEGEYAAAAGQIKKAFLEFGAAEEGFLSVADPFTGGVERAEERIAQIRLRKAEMMLAMNQPGQALRFLSDSDNGSPDPRAPILLAKRDFVLSHIARRIQARDLEQPIVLLNRAMKRLESENISEIAWKVSFDLGKEYLRRGNRHKAVDHFAKTRLILEYFASQFRTPSLRERYLATDSRSEVLASVTDFAAEVEKTIRQGL